ncbi:MAG TPA: DUF4336 domain-containing protein [Leptolyngbyaceae cyanobacterium M33_DOE_097]|uniref:DUF4336 domain-containing protein n=1 Tax=Oscillatoriales cyanobacterium SpSt-418 TaxID=2282169 RepID=A0A7C3PEQ4_9CYAN|nr:DUF4336 domain-containing protein [Leptolyngbyaceae cyanobacterium M33_DOE_097]
MAKQASLTEDVRDWVWRYWLPVPLYPYGRRRTLRREVVQDTIWTFDQLQGILYVTVPIRMTVVKLEAGGLLVYAPVAPTRECLRLMQELVAVHGDVKYIILPTVSGLEHKVFVGPFARAFPQAQVFIAPNQWSFPLNLPLTWLGFPRDRTFPLPASSEDAPFGDEFDYATLGPIQLGLGQFEEVAFYHRRSQSLLVTDSVVSVPAEPPAIVQLDPYPLLFHAKESATDVVADTLENRRKGWRRIALFAFYFRPSALSVVPFGKSVLDAMKAGDRSRKAYLGWYPFAWNPGWERSFEALRGGGHLFVAPILQTLILNRAPEETLAWADRVAQWRFHRILPCHFEAPIEANPAQFRRAFHFLEAESPSEATYPLPAEDFGLLKELETALSKSGITPPVKR